MRVLVLGGTGSIGSAVVTELLKKTHIVTTLCRSNSAAARARELGAAVLAGSICAPADWVDCLSDMDAVIHVATGFGTDAADVDRALLSEVFKHAAGRARLGAGGAAPDKLRFIYTGGMWLFGSRSAAPHAETPYQAPAPWQWAADGCRRVLLNPDIHGMVIHPANVTDDEAGVPPILLADARAAGHIRMPISEEATWPLVRRDDLARLYAMVLEHGAEASVHFGVSEAAVSRAELVRRTALVTGLAAEVRVIPIEVWQLRYGEWAIGYSLSQTGAPPADSAKPRLP